MDSLIGFSLFCTLSPQKIEAAITAQKKALGYFTHLQYQSITVGASRLELWGHNKLNERVHYLPDGALLALIGSPLGDTSLLEAGKKILNTQNLEEFEIPWDGRVILLLISADGKRWTIWNDWLGSIPVFYTDVEDGRIVSTLEPVIVSAAGFSSDNFFMPALVSLLINGHYLSDWTLYKDMRAIPPDSLIAWDEQGFRTKKLRTVQPSQSRWETGWDDLVDEMHELSHTAVADTLKAQPTWILPLSSGLDSRLIAGVAADIGADVHAYAWGASHTTDVVFSRQIAKTLGYPWKHIELPSDFLVKYTQPWADIFGSSMHFHGMYQMAFLDLIKSEPAGSIISGFIGEVLAGDDVNDLAPVHSSPGSYQLYGDWSSHWTVKQVKTLMKVSVDDALETIAMEFRGQIDALPGAWFQKLPFLGLWNRQRRFTYFQSLLSDYWRGVANPFMNRAYARFCMSLPRAALDNRRLLGDVFRRYYGPLSVIPGTYAKEPYKLTGQYLVKQRIVRKLPSALRRGPFAGFDDVPLRMDMESVQASGKEALWPIYTAWDQLDAWLDVNQVEQAYQDVMNNLDDIRPLRKLQSIQAFAYRLNSK